MFTTETYQDVLSENGYRDHAASSAWIVVVAVTVALILFA